MQTRSLILGLFVALAACRRVDESPATPRSDALARERLAGELELVAMIDSPMPTGITVSRARRVFINFPRWGDDVPFTVAEVVDGRAVAYPDPTINEPRSRDDAERFVSVQSVVVDPLDRLWVLDTGAPDFGPTVPGGPKLIAVDLANGVVLKKIVFPREVAREKTYLNDVRFDLRRGAEGLAFITDSGIGGLIVVDLATGDAWRRLDGHPSVLPEPDFTAVVEARFLGPLAIASDGIALDAKGERLYYCPLSARRLYSVAVDALADRGRSDEQVAATVQDHGFKPASDGLEADADGAVYATDYEHSAVHRFTPGRGWELVAHDPRLLWPDTLALASDGALYLTANQLHRQPRFHDGKDLRERPYPLFRLRLDRQPVALAPAAE